MDVSFMRLIKVLSFTFLCCLCTIAEDVNYGFCVNPSCTEPVGEGLTIQGYNAPDTSKVSFRPNERFTIFVKKAGPRGDLFGIQIRGVKGYAPSNLVKEDKAFVPSNRLVPAETDFLFTDINSNNMVNQIQSSSQWSHQDGQSFSHTDGSFQSGEQSGSQLTHQDAQSHMSHTDHTFQGHSSSQWPNPEVHFIMPSSQGNAQPGEQNYRSDYDYYYSGHPGASYSAQYHYSSEFYASSDEIHTPFEYHSEGSSNLEPSVQVRVQVQTNSEHLAGSQRNTHQQMNQPFISDYANQAGQWRNAPLESSFTGHYQDNSLHSHHLQNPHSSEEHVRNSDYELRSPSIPSQRSEFETLSSEVNSQQFVAGSNQYQSSALNTLQYERQQNIIDTMEMLKKQGVDIGDYTDMLQADPSLQNNLNPSQYAQFTQNTNGAGYGHSSSSHFESSNELLSEYPSSREDINPSLPSATNEDKKSFEMAKPLDHQETSTLGYGNQEDTTQSVVMDVKEKGPEEIGLDEDDGEESDDEINVEEEEDDVEDLTPSEDSEMESKDEAVHSDSHLQQKETATSTQSDTETTELYSHDVNSVSQPEVKSTHVQEPSFTSDSRSSLDSSYLKPDIVPPTDDQGTSAQEEIVREIIPTDSGLNSLEEKKVDSNIADGSNLDVTSEMQSDSLLVSQTATSIFESSKSLQIPNNSKSENTDINTENLVEMLPDADQFTKVSSELSNTVFSFDKTEETLGVENVNETDNLSDREQETDLYKILNISELSESEKVGYIPYQIRNLKEENGAQDNLNVESDEEPEDNATYVEFDFYGSVENSLEAIRSFIEILLSWVPEPLYSIIMDVQKSGISPRVPVFTIISSIPCISLIIAIVYIKEKSKEKKLTALLALSEKNVYMLTAEKNILEEKIEKTSEELKSSSSTLDTERSTYETLKSEVENLKRKVQQTSQELESSLEEIDTLKEREKEYAELVFDHEKVHLELREEKTQVENKVLELEEAMSSLNSEIIEKDLAMDDLQKEKLEYLQSSKDYEEKLSQLQQNCNQLLKEAEVWNMRVNELTSKLSEMSTAKDELENSLKLKDSEIESLTHLVETLKLYEELEITDGDETKSNEEKLRELLNSTSILIKLQNQEEENKALLEKLSGEKSKILEMEVELLDTKSDCDKLKLSYNQALQDKAEAQTKLDVLTNYFKDKEIQMQKQIGAQEAVREKREKDADSAERRICLIEQENSSYKYQVASMKQEMEETERNLKSQIATQEKKAHENWIAARAAERKLEDMKQEVTQLRQRLTLLEREQENWTNSSRDEIIRPVPKRISGINDESATSQDMNNSMDLRHNIFPPPPPHPMMLPLDRPLPPLPPPHHLPPFLPPPPPLEGQFRMQPWPPHSMPGSDYRITPPDFGRGRASTPPRGHHSAIADGDMVPMQSSPLGGEMRDSRNSTPPHSLPDFHDIPPPPRPFFPPPGAHPRYPLPPPFRRDMNQGPRKTDNTGDHSSSQSSALQDNWPHSNSRV